MTVPTALRRLAVGASLVVILAACSSTPAAISTPTATPATVAAPTTVPTATATVTVAPTVTPTAVPSPTAANGVVVDLVVSGQDAAVIKGAAGECKFGVSSGNAYAEYTFRVADYPSLGPNGSFALLAGWPAPAWISGQINGHYLQSTESLKQPHGTGAGITVSADLKSVTLDADLSNNTVTMPYSGFAAVTGHVKGTIVCA